MFTLPRRLASEFLGTAFLLMGVVGSGIMGTNLSPDDGVALLANMAATGAILSVLIMVFGPVSGAHFNPAVTFVFLFRKRYRAWNCHGLYRSSTRGCNLWCGKRSLHVRNRTAPILAKNSIGTIPMGLRIYCNIWPGICYSGLR